MNLAEYLKRIGLNNGEITPNVETLRLLQRAHLLAVPFENLDIHWKRRIVLDTETFYSKIVGERRGGFCYELNGLFNELLKSVGFETRFISARVSRPDETFGLEFDHAAIITSVDRNEFLVDVGFGDFTAEPLRFLPGEKQSDANGIFAIDKTRDGAFVVKKRTDEIWKSEYLFTDTPRELSEFAEMCDFQQYSPESHFTKGKLCSIMTETGRKTLTDDKLIVTTDKGKVEQTITSEEMFGRVLLESFRIESPIRAIADQ